MGGGTRTRSDQCCSNNMIAGAGYGKRNPASSMRGCSNSVMWGRQDGKQRHTCSSKCLVVDIAWREKYNLYSKVIVMQRQRQLHPWDEGCMLRCPDMRITAQSSTISKQHMNVHYGQRLRELGGSWRVEPAHTAIKCSSKSTIAGAGGVKRKLDVLNERSLKQRHLRTPGRQIPSHRPPPQPMWSVLPCGKNKTCVKLMYC